MRKILVASTSIAMLTLPLMAAKAQDVRVTGVVTSSHAGTANYGFIVAGQKYVIPMLGFGQAVQALKVELAKQNGLPIEFLADPSQIIPFHAGNQGFLAHDIDP